MHLAGWRALVWQVLSPALLAVWEAAAPGGAAEVGEPAAELEPDPWLEEEGEAEGPEPPDSSSPAAVNPEPVQPDAEGLEEAPPSAMPPTPEATPAPEAPDFAAMTKAEIIEHCSRSYGVLLDSSLTKSALVTEAEAMANGNRDGGDDESLGDDLLG